jgi:hypothetical protein
MNKNGVLILVLMIIIISCSSNEWTQELTANLFGKGILLSKRVGKYHSGRAINGDGYSIDVFKLPEEYINEILANFGEIKKEYPQKPDYRDKWESVGWQESPIKEDEKLFYDFIVLKEEMHLYYSLHSSKAIKYFIDSINEESNHYCYNYNLHKWSDGDISVGDIDFYVFCPKEKLLICINHNT